MKSIKRRALILLAALLPFTNAGAVTTPEIVASTLNYGCVQWRLDGICIWLTCTPYGCSTSTSMKVSHYNPETVVSGYGHTGFNPWREVMFYSQATPTADGMGYLTAQNKRRNNLANFKNADVIGHPGSISDMGFSMLCDRTTTSFQPYFLSTLDYYAWRWGITEQIYPASYIRGLREMAPYITGNNWGNIFPRQGYLVQPDDYKVGAVIAQRAADITSNIASPHVYQTTQGAGYQGYWPPGPVMEMNPLNHKWQGLHPYVEPFCYIFPTALSGTVEENHGYAWALWRPYSCCQQAGQRLIYFSPHAYF
ncbi:MAG: TIGR03756 family integrating conjugative element protein [Burkholderiales bacterium]|jgi:integrating conjugative element protein (TIGR03756 family)|nr:TIGR03756 family integrating conjugative element protein [Burkholderiales bacterium]